MDIHPEILQAGIKTINGNLIHEKNPVLLTINTENLRNTSKLLPSLIFSKGVLQHVPPSGIEEFFANISIIANTGTLILVRAKSATETKRISEKSWTHSRADIERAASKSNLILAEVINGWHRFSFKMAANTSSAPSHQI